MRTPEQRPYSRMSRADRRHLGPGLAADAMGVHDRGKAPRGTPRDVTDSDHWVRASAGDEWWRETPEELTRPGSQKNGPLRGHVSRGYEMVGNQERQFMTPFRQPERLWK